MSDKNARVCNLDTAKALSNFEASLDSSFSPVCHRTRQQTKERLVSDSAHGSCDDQVVADTLCELIGEVSCTTPLTITSDVAQVFSPSTIIDIEDVPCSCPSTIVTIEDVQHCVKSSGPCHDSVYDEVTLFPSDLEVRDLFSDSYVRLENHLYAVHDIHLDTVDDLPTRGGHSSTCVASPSHSSPPSELLKLGPTTGPPKCAPFSSISPVKTWATVAAKPTVFSSEPWAGRQLSSPSAYSTTPLRPGPTRTSRPVHGNECISHPIARSAVKTARQQITFKAPVWIQMRFPTSSYCPLNLTKR
ncbi:hypothetical protein CEXT_154231 [Caerostris extrusa]|uniref:Uncharacterized protein n=1 Tax=Caerostris extrusa TaxID=172846 RepID=A0AAV4X832_CAEEX|nr:hypothetical protein CEXT_154231 [Caerostris extrusa]